MAACSVTVVGVEEQQGGRGCRDPHPTSPTSLQKPAALPPSSAAAMGAALGTRAVAISSSTARMLQMK